MTSTATAGARTAGPTVGSLLLYGLAAILVAAAATALVAVAGSAAGISVAIAGAPIPAAGFAVLTVGFGLVGLVIAVLLRRFAPRPRVAWLATTVVLTVVSFVPDVLADADLATKLLLIGAHVVAAAIVIPVVARRLP